MCKKECVGTLQLGNLSIFLIPNPKGDRSLQYEELNALKICVCIYLCVCVDPSKRLQLL